jgi:hypothetical protein
MCVCVCVCVCVYIYVHIYIYIYYIYMCMYMRKVVMLKSFLGAHEDYLEDNAEFLETFGDQDDWHRCT